ncbi:MAG: hypothetical protein SVY41_01390 [Candidatus Nanohaloarchaea archaeon]|nr:hypothetical protein [Candidatus Nanohaloarchaea archaeon]
MPFTLFHLGPAALLGLAFYRYLDLPTFLAANVIVDVRAALILLGPWEGQFHGPLQTFAGGTVIALLLAAAVYRFYGPVQQVMEWFDLGQVRDRGRILAAAVLGIWLHIVLDSMLWSDMQPFAPFTWNLFLGVAGLPAVHIAAIAAGLVAVPVYMYGRRTGRYPEPV